MCRALSEEFLQVANATKLLKAFERPVSLLISRFALMAFYSNLILETHIHAIFNCWMVKLNPGTRTLYQQAQLVGGPP